MFRQSDHNLCTKAAAIHTECVYARVAGNQIVTVIPMMCVGFHFHVLGEEQTLARNEIHITNKSLSTIK